MACRYRRPIPSVWIALLIALTPLPSLAAVEPVLHDRFARDKMNCRAPVPLTRDCSDRKGPTRPIALDRFRMTLAGTSDGRTLFINQIRYAPDHNGLLFAPEADQRDIAVAAIKALRRWLYDSGACLERWQALRHAGQDRGYLLTFSVDVYDQLQRLTLLESEHWLPHRVSRR